MYGVGVGSKVEGVGLMVDLRLCSAWSLASCLSRSRSCGEYGVVRFVGGGGERGRERERERERDSRQRERVDRERVDQAHTVVAGEGGDVQSAKGWGGREMSVSLVSCLLQSSTWKP